MTSALYEADFSAWTVEQANLLKSRNFGALDVKNLIEEIESMGRSEHRALSNRFGILIGNLLKWQYQPERRGNSWRAAIMEQRRQILRLLKESPSMKGKLSDSDRIEDVWESGIMLAMAETGLDKNIFPDKPIWTIEQLLSQDFLPDSDFC